MLCAENIGFQKPPGEGQQPTDGWWSKRCPGM